MRTLKKAILSFGMLSLLLFSFSANSAPNNLFQSGFNQTMALQDKEEDDDDVFSAMDVNDFFNRPMEDPEKLVAPFTIVVDEEAAGFSGGFGYIAHVEATYVLNKVWYQGPGIFANQRWMSTKTPAQFLKKRGGILHLKPGESLPFRMKTMKGQGTGWNGSEKQTFHNNETYNGDTPSALLTRTATGARLLVHNPAVDDDGQGLLHNFADLHATVLEFELSEAELKNCAKRFSRQLTSAEYQQKGSIGANLTAGFVEDLKAEFTYSGVKRGEIALDGSKSTGNIQKYTWSFEGLDGQAMPEGVRFDGDIKLEGKTVRVILLAPVKVILTVTNDKGMENTKELTVAIQPRNWKTSCKHDSNNIGVIADRVLKSTKGAPPLGIHYGQNTCALCAEKNESGSIYHPDGTGSGFNKTFDNNGYTLSKVEKGPFTGTCYVEKYNIEIHRRPLINVNFVPGTPFYNLNVKYKTDIAVFRQSTLEHEAIHTALLQEVLAKHDPAKDLEQLFGEERDALKERADQSLLTTETELLQEFGNDEEVRKRLYQKYKNQQGVLAFENSGDPEQPVIFVKLFYFNKQQSME